MDAIGSGTAAGEHRARGRPPRPRRRWRPRRAAGSVLSRWRSFGGGFFVVRPPRCRRARLRPARNADGIVALTGGPFRINDALDLLAAGRGKRLLISGVNPATRPGEISRLMPEHQRWFTCCVDIDHSATNTIGNAIETRRWVEGPRLPVADRRDRELPHAARHGGIGARASGCDAGALCGGFGEGAGRGLVGKSRDRTAALFGVSEVYRRPGPYRGFHCRSLEAAKQSTQRFKTWSSSGPSSSTSCSI